MALENLTYTDSCCLNKKIYILLLNNYALSINSI